MATELQLATDQQIRDELTSRGYAIVLWSVIDVQTAAEQQDGELSTPAALEILNQIDSNLCDMCIERGWEVIESAVYTALKEQEGT